LRRDGVKHQVPNTAWTPARNHGGESWSGLWRLDPVATGAAGSATGAIILVAATVVLLLQGPAPGHAIGESLSVLGQYFPGYSVSWPGVPVAAGYGALAGGAVGLATGVMWNVVNLVIIRLFLFQWLMRSI
jgi:hypothetical protein